MRNIDDELLDGNEREPSRCLILVKGEGAQVLHWKAGKDVKPTMKRVANHYWLRSYRKPT
jgi:hypothetical protein